MKKSFNQSGTVLLLILVAVTLLGLSAGIAGSSWRTVTQRAKEKELLWRGNQIRKAIESYYKTGHAGMRASLPEGLDDLLRDSRFVTVVRHLRKEYLDPMAGDEWQFIHDPDGRLKGVYSSSDDEPFKKSGFSEENKNFDGSTRYSDWKFVFVPRKSSKAATQNASGTSQ